LKVIRIFFPGVFVCKASPRRFLTKAKGDVLPRAGVARGNKIPQMGWNQKKQYFLKQQKILPAIIHMDL